MKNIYIVTRGSYSDYGIVGVFDDKELAEQFIKKTNDDYEPPQIEEYILNIPSEKFGYIYYCRADSEGVVNNIIGQNFISKSECLNKVENYKSSEYGIYVLAKNSEHARKIAADKIREHRACTSEQ